MVRELIYEVVLSIYQTNYFIGPLMITNVTFYIYAKYENKQKTITNVYTEDL